jgi:hypothetical protein
MIWFEGFGIVPRGQGIVADAYGYSGHYHPRELADQPFNIAGDEFDPAARV